MNIKQLSLCVFLMNTSLHIDAFAMDTPMNIEEESGSTYIRIKRFSRKTSNVTEKMLLLFPLIQEGARLAFGSKGELICECGKTCVAAINGGANAITAVLEKDPRAAIIAFFSVRTAFNSINHLTSEWQSYSTTNNVNGLQDQPSIGVKRARDSDMLEERRPTKKPKLHSLDPIDLKSIVIEPPLHKTYSGAM